MYRKEFNLVEKATPEIPDAVGSWVISSTSYDRVNDRISAKALASQVGKDLICLWQHSADQPIGKWTNLRMKGDKLVADLILAKTNLGMMIRELLSISTPLGASVGFRGKGDINDKGGIDFKEISLLETSVVSVPCNPDAMAIAKKFDLSSVIEDGVEPARSGITPNETVTRARQAILRANKELRK